MWFNNPNNMNEDKMKKFAYTLCFLGTAALLTACAGKPSDQMGGPYADGKTAGSGPAYYGSGKTEKRFSKMQRK